jgi:hypothetical protein
VSSGDENRIPEIKLPGETEFNALNALFITGSYKM